MGKETYETTVKNPDPDSLTNSLNLKNHLQLLNSFLKFKKNE
jgi:hypothetical protein